MQRFHFRRWMAGEITGPSMGKHENGMRIAILSVTLITISKYNCLILFITWTFPTCCSLGDAHGYYEVVSQLFKLGQEFHIWSWNIHVTLSVHVNSNGPSSKEIHISWDFESQHLTKCSIFSYIVTILFTFVMQHLWARYAPILTRIESVRTTVVSLKYRVDQMQRTEYVMHAIW